MNVENIPPQYFLFMIIIKMFSTKVFKKCHKGNIDNCIKVSKKCHKDIVVNKC